MPLWELDAFVTTCLYQVPSIVSKESRQLFWAGPSMELKVPFGDSFQISTQLSISCLAFHSDAITHMQSMVAGSDPQIPTKSLPSVPGSSRRHLFNDF